MQADKNAGVKLSTLVARERRRLRMLGLLPGKEVVGSAPKRTEVGDRRRREFGELGHHASSDGERKRRVEKHSQPLMHQLLHERYLADLVPPDDGELTLSQRIDLYKAQLEALYASELDADSTRGRHKGTAVGNEDQDDEDSGVDTHYECDRLSEPGVSEGDETGWVPLKKRWAVASE